MSDNRFRMPARDRELRPEGVLPPGEAPCFSEAEGVFAAQGASASGDSAPVSEGRPSTFASAGSSSEGAVEEAGAGQPQDEKKPQAEETVASGPSLDELNAELEKVRAELAATKDQLLRAYAELDNFRKRVARQLEEERRYSELALLRDLLPVLDDIYRAIEAAEAAPNAASLREGFRLVAEHLEQVLARHHCVRIEAEGQPFDPNVHEAVAQEPSDTHPANTVIRVLRTGYRLHDRVVRAAQVVVSKGQSPAPANN